MKKWMVWTIIIFLVVLLIVGSYFALSYYNEKRLIREFKEINLAVVDCLLECPINEVMLDYENSLGAINGEALKEKYGVREVVYQLDKVCYDQCIGVVGEKYLSEEPKNRQHYADFASIVQCSINMFNTETDLKDCLSAVRLKIVNGPLVPV